MNDRSVLGRAGRTLVTVLSVIFFTAAACAVLGSVGYALFQASPIWTPFMVEGAPESENEPIDEDEE